MSDSPRVDLRASNNVLHVRTCSDSARLLAQLIVYLASYGDLEINQSSSTCADPPESNLSPAVPAPVDNINILSESTVQRVNTLMEEAMIDDIKDPKKSKG